MFQERENVKDVMVDLETWGNGKNACIVQIGACYFDRYTGEIAGEFKRNVDARSAVKSGAEIDADTIYWWMKQSEEARKSFLEEPLDPIHETMIAFNLFLSYGCTTLWSHATFDFVIIMETFKRLGIRPKVNYKAARDIRTLVDLSGVNTKDVTREGVHHDALDDAKFQVKYCVEAFRKLKSLPPPLLSAKRILPLP